MVKNPYRWLTLIVLGVVLAIFAYLPGTTNREVRRSASPDGTIVAMLVETTRVGLSAHGYRVCFLRPFMPLTPQSCNEVAYLTGPANVDLAKPVQLKWVDVSHLEIHYPSGAQITIYQPMFIWHSPRNGRVSTAASNIPISIRGVPIADREPPA